MPSVEVGHAIAAAAGQRGRNLVDDIRHFVNKATAARSIVTLQTWTHRVYVRQLFHPILPECREAVEEIGCLLLENA